MLVDWFTVAAQLVNFAILVWLLKRFLYHPVLAAMEAREQHVRETVAAAEEQRAQAEAEAQQLHNQQQEFRQQREQALAAARDEAADVRKHLLAKAREDAGAQRQHWRDALERDWRDFRDELTRRTQSEALAIARQALAELADSDLESRMTAAFLLQLDQLDAGTKARFESAGDPELPLLVRSGRELPPDLRRQVVDALTKRFVPRRDVRFETDPGLIAGIEVSCDGQKLAWSLDDHLRALEADLRKFTESPPP